MGRARKPARREPQLKTPYRRLLPPLAHDEFAALRASIRRHGVLNPVLVTESGKVLDGHHRLKLDPHAPRRVVSGLTEAEQEALALVSNTGRRNLSPAQRKELLTVMRGVALKLRAEDPRKNTHARIAKRLGMSRQTVTAWVRPSGADMHRANDGQLNEFSLWADSRFSIPSRFRPEIVRRHLSGESQTQIAANYKVSQATISRIIARYERDQQAAREAEKAAAGAAKLGELGIVVGDYRNAGHCIAHASVELIFTDPPFERRYIKQYTDLGRFATRVLKPGGSLVSFIPDFALPDVLSLVLQSPELRFWWAIAVQHGGQTAVLDKFGINVRHKTLLWFVKGGQRARRAQVDSLIVSRPDKRFHAWGQGVEEAAYFIEKLTSPGGLVVDPYAGGGTTCVAAIAAGRQYVAFEKDRRTALKARARVAECRPTGSGLSDGASRER